MFPQNLRKLRNAKNLSMDELVKRLNDSYEVKFSKATLSRWEDGLSSPSIVHASALADFFNVSLDELSGRQPLDYSNDVIAAHIDDDVTEDEMKDILQYIEFIKGKNK